MLLNEWISSQSLEELVHVHSAVFWRMCFSLGQSHVNLSWMSSRYSSPHLSSSNGCFSPLCLIVSFPFSPSIALLQLIKVNEPRTTQPQVLSVILYLPFLFFPHFPNVIPKALNDISAVLTWHSFFFFFSFFW